MKRVTGIGGVFFKAKDLEKLRAWYQKHLGLGFDAYGSVVFDCPTSEEQRKTYQDFPENLLAELNGDKASDRVTSLIK